MLKEPLANVVLIQHGDVGYPCDMIKVLNVT